MVQKTPIKDLTPEQAARFWAKVAMTGSVTECWFWRACIGTSGYGRITVGGRGLLAHRVSWALTFGKLDHELEIDHLCRDRTCVNPWHLDQVTGYENMMRGDAPEAAERRWARQTTCKAGHALTDDNVSLYLSSGYACRKCLTCNRERLRAEYRRRHR